MAENETGGGVFQRLDKLNEYERQPISENKLHGGGYFAGNFAGEHVAATEFVIGALFVQVGASAYDVLVGLLVGNLLAVLSWALVCAPIATDTRLTLYWYLRKIAGPGMTVIYNVLNAILYCILAGCMITVSASAVRIAFGLDAQTGWMPTDPYFVLVVIGVGAVVVALAILGFKRLAQFAWVCSPWMLMMFVAGALVTLPELARMDGMTSVRGWSDFWQLANKYIWLGHTLDNSPAWSFWHIAFFAWICNLAMHLGLSDMALFRYAKRSAYGYYSALGMFLGHYLAWIFAGIMGATIAATLKTPLGNLDSGEVAFQALGIVGAVAVVIAGWTTSNPTLYRAGLALQVVTPGWPRWLVTLLAGAITTAIACFPFVFRGLLGFVALYGILLVPVGTIVVLEHWVFPRIGFTRYWSARKGQAWSWPALVSWFIPLALAFGCWYFDIIHQNFLIVPVWLLTAVLYLVTSAIGGARESLPELPELETASTTSDDDQLGELLPPSPAYYVAGALALISLLLCLLLPALVFLGSMSIASVKTWLVPVSVVYFLSGIVWMTQREKRQPVQN